MNLRTLSVTEAVEATGFSRDRIYELVHAREVAVVRSAGAVKPRIRIIASSLEEWMARAATPARPVETTASRIAGIVTDLELPTARKPLFS